ncbi:MAG TPA: hypothetical protein VJH87_17800 [Vicinamibacteria bacterium]|nr:hypothetical protein [Vicinamibacteria bacterium]
MSALPLLLLLAIDVPAELRSCVASIRADSLGGVEPLVEVTREPAGILRFRLTFDLPQPVAQDDWRIDVEPAFAPDFHWSPHLTPTPRHVVDQHSFRSPALIASGPSCTLALIPDLDLLLEGSPVRWYMDLDAPARKLTLGMSDTEVEGHVFYVRKPGASYPKDKVQFGFFALSSTSPEAARNPFRPVLSFLWERYGRALFREGRPLKGDLTPYVEHTYHWAFESWRDAVWQEFELEGKKVGAPAFIVNQTQSPNYPGEVDEREFRSIWNQAWFSSLRSASGLFRWARARGNEELLAKARMTKELALLAPVKDGFFPALVATEMETVNGLNRSRGWATAFWGNSDRNPVNRVAGSRSADPRIAPYHVLDMSWTSLLMLRWHEELEPDERLLAYATRYGDALLRLQDERGFFPAWLDRETLKPLGVLDDSPETSLSVTFLLALTRVTGKSDYRDAALRAMNVVATEIVPQGRWEDFETYWSCSSWGIDDLLGKKVERNDLHKQNTFSMFWTAEALLETYRATGKREHLELGERVLDELLMAQASWQPPYMYVDVLGGFGVMNADGEWNDSRESLFAETIVRYGQELSREEYVQRGLAALRSSFVMMYAPENPRTKEQWEKRHPFFGPKDYGFTMENYGHGGRTSPEGEGMGVFTIYDWGNGAAAEAYNRMIDHFGPELVHRNR